MMVIKRTIKIQILGLIAFALLSVISALIFMFTPLKEAWYHAVIIAAMTLSCIFVGMLEGNAVSKRGLLSGIAASIMLIFLILVIVNLVFDGEFKPENNDIFLTIPLIAGGIGGVVGTNMDKSS